MKKFYIIAIVLIFLIVALSGCSGPKEPKEVYKELIAKGKILPNGKFEYNINFGSSEGGGSGGYPYGGLNMVSEIYSFNGNTKKLVSVSLMGATATTAQYTIGNNLVTCTESGYYSSSSISCEKGIAASQSFFYQDNSNELVDAYAEKADIQMTGEKTFAGRKCKEFQIRIDKKDLEELLKNAELKGNSFLTLYGSSILKDVSLEYTSCLDTEYGFPVYFKSKYKKYSELAGKETAALEIGMELKSFTAGGVSEKDLKIPVDFKIAAKCDGQKAKISITAFNPVSGNVNIKIRNYSYSTTKPAEYEQTETVDIGNMQFGDDKNIDVQINAQASSNKEITVCTTEDKCVKTTCYISSYYNNYNTQNLPAADKNQPIELLGHWKLNGNATDTAGNNNGTVHGATVDSEGKFDQAYNFSGKNEYIETEASSTLGICSTQPITMSMWIKTTSTPKRGQAGIIIADGGRSSGNFDKGLGISSTGNAVFYVWDGSAERAVGSSKINDGKWHLITGEFDGRGIKIFVDGVMEGSANAYRTQCASSPKLVMSFAMNKTIDNENWEDFKGSIDDVRIYKGVLSQTQISELYRGKDPTIK